MSFRPGRRPKWLSISCLAFVMSIAIADGVSAQDGRALPEFEINTPQTDAATALNQLAIQTKSVLLFPYRIAKSRSANPVKGRYTILRALAVMLEGSGLNSDLSETGVIRIYLPDKLESATRESNVMKKPKKSFLTALLGLFSVTSIQAAKSEDGSLGIKEIEEVLVTANRREENLQDISASVSLIDVDKYRSVGLNTLEDALSYTPGVLLIDDGFPGSGSLTLRGIPQVGSVPTSAVYVDDVPLSTNTAFAGSNNIYDGMLADIERIEVVKGPQGTLYGSVSVGGLIKYVTRKPALEEMRANVGVQVSQVEEGDLSQIYNGRISVPVIENKLGVTLAGFYEDQSGYVDQVDPATLDVIEEDINDSERTGFSADVLFNITKATSVRAKAQYQETEYRASAAVFLQSNESDAALFSPYSSIESPGTISQTYENYSLIFEHEFDWASLTSVSSLAEYENVTTLDITASALAPIAPGIDYPIADFLLGRAPGTTNQVLFVSPLSSEKFIQEIRLTSPSNNQLEWVAGLYFTDEETSNAQDGPTIPEGSLISVDFPSEFSEIAGFGNVTYYMTPDFDLSVGLRVSETAIEFTNTKAGPLVGVPTGLPPVVEVYDEVTDTVATYSLALRYRASEDLSIYGRVATGYRPPSSNIPVVNPLTGEPIAGSSLDSDEITSYEVGVKGSNSASTVYYELTAWASEFDEFQTGTSILGVGTGVNYDGSMDAKGLEGFVQINPLSGLTISASFSYTDSELSDGDPGLGTIAGEAHPGIPELMASARADYAFTLGDNLQAKAGLGVRHVGEVVSGFNRTLSGGQVKSDGYTLFDADASVNLDKLTVGLYVTNLLDDIELQNRSDGPLPQGVYTTPRTIGVSLNYDL